MKRFIISNRHLIVLIWLLIILCVFKVTTNFNFHHGLSILFIFLLISFPLFVYLYTIINNHKIRVKNKLNHNSYFELIKNDYQQNKISSYLNSFTKLGLQVQTHYTEHKIKIDLNNDLDNYFTITFYKNEAIISINKTLINFHYYYGPLDNDMTKYDCRNFQYKDPQILYNKIKEQITTLLNHEYLYIQTKKEIILIEQGNNTTIYKKQFTKRERQQLNNIKEKIIIDLTIN